MIRNNSVPLRIPPHWINRDSDEELEKKMSLRKLSPHVTIKKSESLPFDPNNFIDPDLMHEAFKTSSWAIQYLDFLIRSGEYAPVNSASGRIEEMLLTVFLDPNDQQYNTHQKQVYTALLKSLGSNRRYKILCSNDEKKTIEGWFTPLGLENVKFDYYWSVFNVTCWAQDPYVALYSRKYQRTILAESNDFNRFDDQTIACDVGAQSDTIFDFPSYYYLQGGNLLCALDHILIGKDYVMKNTGRAFLGDQRDVLESFSGLFNGKNCLSVGLPDAIPTPLRVPKNTTGKCVTALSFSGTWQPVFHIDMFLTPTGIRTSGPGNQEILLVGSLNEAKKALKGQTSKEVETINKHCDAYGKYFEDIANELKSYFNVVLIPVYPGNTSFGYGGVEYETNYYLTYNNVVIESFEDEQGVGHKNVVMPTYGITDQDDSPDHPINQAANNIRICLDAYATKIWQGVGFKVYPIGNMESFASSGGAVHCLTKTLERSNKSIQKPI